MKNDRLWGLSALVCGIAVIVIAVNSLSSMSLPDWLIRICGILGLIALAVLSFATVRKTKK